MAQQQVHKQKPSASVSRARKAAEAQDDRMHDERLADARTAVVRARRLTDEATKFLESLDS
jgi:hypothetical protein